MSIVIIYKSACMLSADWYDHLAVCLKAQDYDVGENKNFSVCDWYTCR